MYYNTSAGSSFFSYLPSLFLALSLFPSQNPFRENFFSLSLYFIFHFSFTKIVFFVYLCLRWSKKKSCLEYRRKIARTFYYFYNFLLFLFMIFFCFLKVFLRYLFRKIIYSSIYNLRFLSFSLSFPYSVFFSSSCLLTLGDRHKLACKLS